jgi:hypothetical protein
MFLRKFALRLSRLAAVVGVAMILGPAAYAQDAEADRAARKRDPIVFTVAGAGISGFGSAEGRISSRRMKFPRHRCG